MEAACSSETFVNHYMASNPRRPWLWKQSFSSFSLDPNFWTWHLYLYEICWGVLYKVYKEHRLKRPTRPWSMVSPSSNASK